MIGGSLLFDGGFFVWRNPSIYVHAMEFALPEGVIKFRMLNANGIYIKLKKWIQATVLVSIQKTRMLV